MKEKLDYMLGQGGYDPVRAHEFDAGIDIRTPEPFVVTPWSSAIIDTKLHVKIPEGKVGFLKSKSGLNVNFNLTGTGVIDSGYQGSIVVKLYNHSDDYHEFAAGDKIIQLVLLDVWLPELNRVYSFYETTERGSNGFGSTGR